MQRAFIEFGRSIPGVRDVIAKREEEKRYSENLDLFLVGFNVARRMCDIALQNTLQHGDHNDKDILDTVEASLEHKSTTLQEPDLKSDKLFAALEQVTGDTEALIKALARKSRIPDHRKVNSKPDTSLRLVANATPALNYWMYGLYKSIAFAYGHSYDHEVFSSFGSAFGTQKYYLERVEKLSDEHLLTWYGLHECIPELLSSTNYMGLIMMIEERRQYVNASMTMCHKERIIPAFPMNEMVTSLLDYRPPER